MLVEGLVANEEGSLKSVVSWLQGKLIAHEGRTAGNPMKDNTIKNYLYGFYILDLFKVDGKFYSDCEPLKRAFVPIRAKIKPIPVLAEILQTQSNELIEERLTQFCSVNSQIVKVYNTDRHFLKENYELSDRPDLSLVRKLLLERCNYSYIGDKNNKSVGYLEIFYQDKIKIDSYLRLLDFLENNYRESARRTLGLIPIAEVLNRLKQIADYREEDFKRYLTQLRLTHRLELVITKPQLAQNMGIELVEIAGVKYGFVKILEPAIAV